MMPSADEYYVYTLAYPNGTVFYVGKGKGRRALDHLAEAERWECFCSKCRIIQRIQSKRQRVRIEYVFITSDERAAYQHERELITQLSTAHTLVNKVHAGKTRTRTRREPRIDPELAELWARAEYLKNRAFGRGANALGAERRDALQREYYEIRQRIGTPGQTSFLYSGDGLIFPDDNL